MLDLTLYDQILADVAPLYLHGRPGDLNHIRSVYATTVRLIEEGTFKLRPRLALPAGILHDCGFGYIRRVLMRQFTGSKRVIPLRDAANELTLATIPLVLAPRGFSPEEIAAIVDVVRTSDEEVLSSPNPSIELQVLHDLNFLDRLLPHRIKTLRFGYTPEQGRAALAKSVERIVLPELRDEALRLRERLPPDLRWELSA